MTRQLDSDTLPPPRRAVPFWVLGAMLVIGIVVSGVLVLLRPAMAEPRPVVLSVY